MKKQVTPGETPAKITVSMIDQDLKDGISKSEMAIKYGIKPWEVDEMFKHPFLKGRRPSRKKTLSFSFVDDVSMTPDGEEVVVDPNQITLHDAIDNAIETIEEVKTELKETEKSVIGILNPAEYETPEETLLKAAVDTPEITGIPNGDTMSDTDDDLEEELKMDDNTFEL